MLFNWDNRSKYKFTQDQSIEEGPIPDKVTIPLSQHTGGASLSIVKKGDEVMCGQKIAEASGHVSVPMHASISGTIERIDERPHPITGRPVESIIIKSDGSNTKPNYTELDHSWLPREQLISKIQDAGIVGLGGAAFPAHVKFDTENEIHTFLVNAAECEPFLSCDYRNIIERAEDLIAGIKIIKNILNVKEIIIGIEEDKKDAIKRLEECVNSNIKILTVKTKYPQGAEKVLVYNMTGNIVPSGGLPTDIGIMTSNVSSIIAIYEAIARNKPLFERAITVSGGVKNPKNVLTRIGTPVNDLIEFCGGYKGKPIKIINGGPMMGLAIPDPKLPVIKGTCGITILNKEYASEKREIQTCINCGNCVRDCPVNLYPLLIAKYSEKNRIDLARKTFAMDCFECGACEYNCPCNIPLVHYIRYGKSQILKVRADT